MRRFLLWLGILGLWSALGAQAVNLADDERLQQTLTIQQPLIPLRELLRLVQRETGVNLSVAAELQNDKVCVLAYGKPAHEILTRLAQSLRYDWRAGVDGKGYTLIQTARERARESALLRAHEQAKLHRLLKPLREIFSLLQRYPYARLQQLPERERLRLLPETRSFLKSLSPTTYELMQLAARLPESAWQGMLASSPIVFSSQPSSSGEFPIPAAVQRALREELSPSGSPRQQVRA
ncbi:MAG: hypothetical protein NZM28_01490, partial [Fimbriimonadales bacterium]|nr:hypothetical protein [Fimbriimonadales bacterium]